MIRHAVYFRFRSDTSDGDVAQHIADFAALDRAISEIRGYEWGRVVTGPDAKNGKEFDVAHNVLFDDVESLRTYIDHPEHQRFVTRNKAIWEHVKVVDSLLSE